MEWRVETVEKDDDGVACYLAQVKPFRLRALATDPSAFGSTLARELAFDDEQWRARLLNPLAKTFVAVREAGGQRHVLSSVTLVGPQPDQDTTNTTNWVVNGVWTAPEARRRGIGAAVMAAAKSWAAGEAASLNKQGQLSVVAFESNADAIAFYEKSGFVARGVGKPGELQLVLRL